MDCIPPMGITVDLDCKNKINGSELKFCYNQGFITNKVLYNKYTWLQPHLKCCVKDYEANYRPTVYIYICNRFSVSLNCCFSLPTHIHTPLHPHPYLLILEVKYVQVI